MSRRLAVLALLSLAVPVLAHEGHVHKLRGTVTAVHADKSHVEMKSPKGEAQSFYVDGGTKIVKGHAPATLADLKPGTRIVVETKTTDGRVIATSVRLGGAPHK
jgi:hypothetical protein